MAKAYYTHYPRAILWLVPGGELVVSGGGENIEIEPFYLSKLPVTNQQYEAYATGFERSPLASGDRDPALGMSYLEAEGYAAWYAEVSRKPIRLPTEAEWEYACLGGGEAGDPGAELWHRGNSKGVVPPLDAKKANGFGLFGMLGGVWEWTAGSGGPVLRGGSILMPAAEIALGIRREMLEGDRIPDGGFRIARSFRR